MEVSASGSLNMENPKRKRSWIYGLPEMKKPTAETYESYKPKKSDKELGLGKFANNEKKPKSAEKPKTPEKTKEPKEKTSAEKQPSVPVTTSTPLVSKARISRNKLHTVINKAKPIGPNDKIVNPWSRTGQLTKIAKRLENVKLH